MPRMSDLTLEVLTKFHRDVVLPDIERIVSRVVGDLELRLNGHLDAIYQRLERLETEYQMLVVGMRRIEDRLDRIEQRLDKVALKSEVQELRSKVEALERRIAEIDAAL